MKYKKNLHVEGSKVFSYSTHVATIDRASGKLYVHGYWSMTTSKHINHVADVLGLHKEDKARDVAEVEAERKAKESEGMAGLRAVGLVAMLGDVFGKTTKESNDWKARMLRAGLEGRGLIMPDDWDTLPEAEKTKRLDGALANLTK
ncbi:MAG: hypothetical protein UW02_C0002G0036 [Candidatus Nomurabacteria bacterium GW2011_GWB1_43_7]|uniref:DUF8033 domain-containing protein n=2 Tax=Parcubacteria group TaxID=1794811 RepID=A0A0G1MAE8_9BACT|nr:MAG: hypothetical protein UW02_C0002G0036 [Candidatus Nomurabacteria bacterium GW2011_GWB1_43_7]KKU05052.1 MAG: hypothetical protein UX06_C0004G0020 [Candidatus Giovannonibacteria bacterium GW2011_GWA2_45_21]